MVEEEEEEEERRTCVAVKLYAAATSAETVARSAGSSRALAGPVKIHVNLGPDGIVHVEPAHWEHVVVPKIGAIIPASHGRHRSHPVSGQYVPGGHGSQVTFSVCPESGDAVPAGHE